MFFVLGGNYNYVTEEQFGLYFLMIEKLCCMNFAFFTEIFHRRCILLAFLCFAFLFIYLLFVL